ncbi:MAG: proteasome assembly chaperone family protein [Methanomassiliicoccales archaeon]|nr:MAG: proteasome assembly chaperone family protein [Methanomassiliicoccales archaeon]
MGAHIVDYGGMFLHEFKDAHLSNCILVVAFPSIGLVSSIAANYMVRTMKLERIATIVSDDFPPYAILQDGIPTHPVRIYAGKRSCDGLGGERCDQIVVILAEFMPKPELIRRLADVIIEWGKHKGVDYIVTLEGINAPGDEVQPLGIGTSQRTREIMDSYQIRAMQEGMVTGISGMLLAEGERLNTDVICLLGPAKAEIPDARGAAKLLEIIGKMLPELKIDPVPLLKEAESIEEGMKAAIESMKQPKKPADTSFLYG